MKFKTLEEEELFQSDEMNAMFNKNQIVDNYYEEFLSIFFTQNTLYVGISKSNQNMLVKDILFPE